MSLVRAGAEVRHPMGSWARKYSTAYTSRSARLCSWFGRGLLRAPLVWRHVVDRYDMVALCGRVVRVGFADNVRALPAWWALRGGLPVAISAEFLDGLDMDGRGKLVSSA